MGTKGERSDSETPDASEISRRSLSFRSLLIVGLLLVGLSTVHAAPGTVATFSDSEHASGTVAIDGEPTLNYQIIDESANTEAEYQIQYQVEWVSDMDHIMIRVNNTEKSWLDPVTDNRTADSGTIPYPSSGNDGNAFGDLYTFNFTVYNTNESVVIRKNTTDVAGGSGSGDGDIGNANSPKLESFTVIDNGDMETDNVAYTVDYTVSNFNASSSVVKVVFEDLDVTDDWPDRTATNNQGNGTVYYPSQSGAQGGTSGDTYRITVKVVDMNGPVVDSANVTDLSADGNNSSYP